MSTVASLQGAGLQGVRLRKKRQIIKGVPRMTSTHEREAYWIFQSADVRVDAGEVLVLVSRDPARTNALMRVWAGLLPVDEGQVERPDRSFLLTSPQNRWVRELSVGQSIRMLAGIYGLSDAETQELVEPAARTAQVETLMSRPLEDLGKQIRDQVAFSVAVHAPLPLVMFDHTAVSGTPQFRPLCPDLVKGLAASGTAVVLATSRPQVALNVGDRAVIVRAKRTQEATVTEAAEFLIRDRVKGRRRARRHAREDDEDPGLEF